MISISCLELGFGLIALEVPGLIGLLFSLKLVEGLPMPPLELMLLLFMI
jgi:hypothetical protein